MRPRHALIASLVAAAVALAGCHDGAQVGPHDDDADGDGADGQSGDVTPVPAEWRRLAHGQQSDYGDGVQTLIATNEAWSGFWEGHAPNASRPEVDFATERVVAVVLSDRPDGCHHVQINGVDWVGEDVRVAFTEYVPTEDMVCTQAITQPNEIIAVQGLPEDVEFVSEVSEGEPDAD